MGNLLDTLPGAMINGSFGLLGSEIANKQSRDNFRWQYENYLSPSAQVRALTSAGINPAVAFGNQSPVISSAGDFSPVSNPFAGVGTSSLTDLANYISAKASAKKSGADTRKTDLEADAIAFENDLNRVFRQPERVANLMAAYKAMQLQDDEHTINAWRSAKEKALSELSGVQRDTAAKILSNMDIQISQENKQREESIKLTQEQQGTQRSQQVANRASAKASEASANASNASAELTKSQKEMQDILTSAERATTYIKRINEIKRLQASNALTDVQKKQAKVMSNRYEWLIREKETTKAQDYWDYMMWYWKNEMKDFDLDVPIAVPLK